MRNVSVQQTNAVQVPHEMTRTQTAQGIPSNKKHTLDLSQASSMWGEPSRSGSACTPQAHDWMPNNIANTVCERFPRVDMLSLLRLTRSMYSWLSRLRSKIHRPVHRRPAVCHLWESAEVLFTEHINHWVPEAIPPFQVSLASWEPVHPVQFPMASRSLTNQSSMAQCKRSFNSDIEQLCENVTQTEKHTPDDKEHLHLRIHHDVLNPRSITMYSSFLPLP